MTSNFLPHSHKTEVIVSSPKLLRDRFDHIVILVCLCRFSFFQVIDLCENLDLVKGLENILSCFQKAPSGLWGF